MVLVSVVTATHNGERFVDETIRSVLSQRDVDFEHIIVDDASTDGTRRIVDQYADPQSPRYDPRVRRFYRDEHKGIIPTYREGINLSRGEFVKILDHDDILPNIDSLADQQRILETYQGVALVASASNFINERGEVYRTQSYPAETGVLDKEKLRRVLLWGPRSLLVHGSMLFRREVFEKFGELDQELLCKILRSEYGIYYVDQQLFSYRNYRGNTSTNLPERRRNFKNRMQLIDVLTEDGLEYLRPALKVYRVFLETLKIAWLQVTPNR